MRLLPVLVLIGISGMVSAAPRLAGNLASPQCRAALAMARERFAATSPTLVWPLPAAALTGNRIVLAQGSEDLSGGHSLVADGRVLRKLALPVGGEYSKDLFVQVSGLGPTRIAVLDWPYNWRGDFISVHTFTDGPSLEELAKAFADRKKSAIPLTTLIDDRTEAPLILQDRTSSIVWAIDRSGVNAAIPDWTIFVPATNGATSPCRVTFADKGRLGLALLPSAVRRLAASLDDALGPGRGEGTLRQTDRVRSWVAVEWANAASRPWALTSPPYNDRATVDRLLTNWARRAPSFAGVHNNIKREYAPAEAALASYFRRSFGISASAARQQAGFALDHLLRSYFVFSNNGSPVPDNAHKPWPH